MIDVQVNGSPASADVRLSGDLDMNGVLKVEPIVDELLRQRELQRLRIDLGGLRFLDSTGLGMLVTVLHRSRTEDVELQVVPAPHSVQRVFETAGVQLPFVDA